VGILQSKDGGVASQMDEVILFTRWRWRSTIDGWGCATVEASEDGSHWGDDWRIR